jgi:hypothetical protein
MSKRNVVKIQEKIRFIDVWLNEDRQEFSES